jgi:hypothetical protein
LFQTGNYFLVHGRESTFANLTAHGIEPFM